MINPMHMQMDRTLDKNAADVFTLASCFCMKQTWGLQKVGFGTVAFAFYPFDSQDVLEDSNQTALRFI